MYKQEEEKILNKIDSQHSEKVKKKKKDQNLEITIITYNKRQQQKFLEVHYKRRALYFWFSIGTHWNPKSKSTFINERPPLCWGHLLETTVFLIPCKWAPPQRPPFYWDHLPETSLPNSM